MSRIYRKLSSSGIKITNGWWYEYQNEKVMGLNGVKQFFLDKPELFDALKHELTT